MLTMIKMIIKLSTEAFIYYQHAKLTYNNKMLIGEKWSWTIIIGKCIYSHDFSILESTYLMVLKYC